MFDLQAALLPDTTYLPALLAEIGAARREILTSVAVVETPSAAPRPILRALRDAAGRGVIVRVILGDSRRDRAIHEAVVALLADAGIPARLYGMTRMTRWTDETGRKRATRSVVRSHREKAVLIDGNRMIVGSHNWITPALRGGRNLSVLLTGEAEAFRPWRERFQKTWGNAPWSGGPVPPRTSWPIRRFAPPMSRPDERVSPHPAPVWHRARGRIVLDGEYAGALHALIGATAHDVQAAPFRAAVWTLEGSLRDPLRRLEAKVRRGLRAEVILDEMTLWPGSREGLDRAIEWLRARRVEARFDSSADTVAYVGAVVGDARHILIGSPHWFLSAAYLDAAVLLDAPDLGAEVAAYMEGL